ncbi:hypothetical protein A4A49_22450 [Nicotiana attenuata]|uniref:Uncharacterized protein n=1 Tax=Nicotiana attenuata TaxID=49451 RepID=A0A1J6I4W4_NICAT|nr:hypothetical protein A4A49_22450 [Nicotiana attenuata]
MMDVVLWITLENIVILFNACRGQHHNVCTREPWPLDGMKFETLKEQHARRNPEDLEIDYEDQFISEDEDIQDEDPISYDSDVTETDAITKNDDWEEEGEETAHAILVMVGEESYTIL